MTHCILHFLQRISMLNQIGNMLLLLREPFLLHSTFRLNILDLLHLTRQIKLFQKVLGSFICKLLDFALGRSYSKSDVVADSLLHF